MVSSDLPGIGDAKILIVDDTPANLGVLSKILEGEGYQVFAAASGERALVIANQIVPDLIVLDVMMPGIDGLETCRRLKASPETQAIPVIFITVLSDIENILDGFRVGAVDYVHKPFRHEEVCMRVRTHLQMCRYLSAYRAETERFRAIVNNMGEGMLQLDVGGLILSANPTALALLNIGVDELIGKSIVELLAAPFAEEYGDYFKIDANPVSRVKALRHGPHEVRLSKSGDANTCIDLTITRIFSEQTAFVALLHDISSHKRSHEELQRIASTDPLTSISNRRHLDAFLSQEWKRGQRSTAPLSLAIFDVDHFKHYNDSLGHQAGDRCLQQVAMTLKSVARRPTDLTARFGGEEFVIVFVDTNAQAAAKLAEDACRAVEALGWAHPSSTTSSVVTISCGVATLVPSAGIELDSLLAAADAALYRAKEKGRNQVVCG